MHVRRWVTVLACGLFVGFIPACGSSSDYELAGRDQEGNPLTYRYLDSETLEVKYQDRLYTLEADGHQPAAPFGYRFEPDGDCDLYLDGRHLEIDSPYDAASEVASSLFKKAKKKSPYKSSRSGSRRRR